jgi:Fe2+ transport system protein FeoA
MASDYLTCPVCGFEFERTDTLCAHGCPLGSLCHLVRCPACEYEFPETPATVSFVKRLFRRRLPTVAGLPPGVRTAAELRPGQKATVLCLGSTVTDRHHTLTVYGLGPDAEITLVQHQPACVIRIGETELALDFDIARDILVQPLDMDRDAQEPRDPEAAPASSPA